MNIQCDKTMCNNNTGFTFECMYPIKAGLIKRAKHDEMMCPVLRNKILEAEEEYRSAFVEELTERLEKEKGPMVIQCGKRSGGKAYVYGYVNALNRVLDILARWR